MHQVKDDQTIVGVSDLLESCINDEFTIASSGTAKFENIRQDFLKESDHNYVLSLTVDTNKIESVQIKLRNNTNEEQTVNYEILTGERAETFLPEIILKKSSLKLEPGFYGFVKLDINEAVGKDQKIYIVIKRNDSISICCSNKRIPGAVSWRYYDETHAYGKYWDKKSLGYNHDTTPFSNVIIDVPSTGEIRFTYDDTASNKGMGYLGADQFGYNMCFKDVVPAQGVYCAENLLNDYSRPYGSMNMWLSDTLGASLTIKAKSPQYIQEMHLVFDTNLENEVSISMQEQLCKDYDLTFVTSKGQKVIHVRDNYLRLNKIQVNLEEVTSIKVDILSTYGSDTAHMYGIKMLK
jgi:hypothetical protein